MKKLMIIIVLGISFSCSTKTKEEDIKNYNSVKKKIVNRERKTVLRLENFSDIPSEIDGCGCFFSKNKSLFEKELYLFVNDASQYGFFKINNKIEIVFLNKNYIKNGMKYYIYENKEYHVTLSFKEKGVSQTGIIEGEIIVYLRKDVDTKINLKFYGECVC